MFQSVCDKKLQKIIMKILKDNRMHKNSMSIHYHL